MSGVNVMSQYQSYFGTIALGGATGLIFSLFYAGAFVAIAIGPFLADTFGRKMPIIVGSIVALCGAIIQVSSMSIQQFRAARFILGFGSSLCFAYGPLITVEMAHPFWRGRLGGLLMIGVLGGNTFSLWMDFACSWSTTNFAWRFPVCLFICLHLTQSSWASKFFHQSCPWSSASYALNPLDGSSPKAATRKPSLFSSNTTASATPTPKLSNSSMRSTCKQSQPTVPIVVGGTSSPSFKVKAQSTVSSVSSTSVYSINGPETPSVSIISQSCFPKPVSRTSTSPFSSRALPPLSLFASLFAVPGFLINGVVKILSCSHLRVWQSRCQFFADCNHLLPT